MQEGQRSASAVADYVVVGAGAVGLAFIDVLLDETDADFVLVDRRAEPGGHWRDAYPYVRLHNVSAIYGVNSTPLGAGRLETDGPDAGCLERAGRTEILAYYDGVLRDRLMTSGRVRWMPRHEWRDGTAVSLDDGRITPLHARRRTVDATFTGTHIPSIDGPGFPVAPGARCISPNELDPADPTAAGWTVIGAGKTAMDVVARLLSEGVDPDAVTWIRARDPWLLDRRRLQPHPSRFEETVSGFAAELEAAAQARSVDDFFLRLEAEGLVLRLDPQVVPTMFRCAIASAFEIEQMRRVKHVVRLGRVLALEPDRVVLERGEFAADTSRVHVHCTADGVPRKPAVPIFQGDRLVPQYVRRCAPVFAAGLIARIEALDLDDAQKNDLCRTVPMVDEPADWLQAHLVEARNRRGWSRVPELRAWLAEARLDGFGSMLARALAAPDPAQAVLLERYRRAAAPAYARMEALLAERELRRAQA